MAVQLSTRLLGRYQAAQTPGHADGDEAHTQRLTEAYGLNPLS